MNNFPIRKKYLEFRWTMSKGKNTYRQTICSLYVDPIIGGVKKASCIGGGYDMKGTSLGSYIEEEYKDRLKKLSTEPFYGFTFYKTDKNGKYKTLKRYSEGAIISLDGAAGVTAMEKVLNAISITLQCLGETKTSTFYTLTERPFNVRRQRQKRVTS